MSSTTPFTIYPETLYSVCVGLGLELGIGLCFGFSCCYRPFTHTDYSAVDSFRFYYLPCMCCAWIIAFHISPSQ